MGKVWWRARIVYNKYELWLLFIYEYILPLTIIRPSKVDFVADLRR